MSLRAGAGKLEGTKPRCGWSYLVSERKEKGDYTAGCEHAEHRL